MVDKIEAASFLNNLERVAQVRFEVATCLERMVELLETDEAEGDKTSGKLGLQSHIADLTLGSKNLRKGVFRLLVLGDMKRGKSTFLNALIGENLLPADVNPCTALLTVLRYGKQKTVTVYFKEGRPPERLDFSTFKQRYTIDPEEAKTLEQEKKLAFPDVNYAVVEYPLALLEKGLEIVDSPGLNDTEARNEMSLNYINNCHGILFVLRAGQPVTLEERRYLDNYIKGRGLTVFFLINAWDEISKGLIDPDDAEELQEAEEKLRQVFQSNLADYCQVDGYDLYEERVFEISSLQALRRRMKDPEQSLEGTGFSEFMGAINRFLTQERAVAQMRQARTLARQSTDRVREAIARRIPLLDRDVNELKAQISSVEPEFEKLNDIRDRFADEIRTVRNQKARGISESFRTYILNLGNTFEADFLRYQPDLSFFDSLNQSKREAFNAAFKQAFEQYLNDKITAWEKTANQEMQDAFTQLANRASDYGSAYSRVTHAMTEKLIGQQIYTRTDLNSEDNSPTWASWAMGLVSLATGNIAGVFLASAGFDWKNILVNSLSVIGIYSFLAIFSIPVLLTGPLGILLVGLGVGALQAEQGRKELINATKKELIKHIPQIAEEQSQVIHQAIIECFDTYDREVLKRLNDDIKSRRLELDNLLKQKQSREINRESELKRLQKLEADIISECRTVNRVYESLISYNG
ncbi:dynamin family protein [Laspinema olomoucense]|uniref:dynamin family protein n=1 Tax=Laspinema olomoucense TaxID=3231600 RepID=UPI0021BADFC2|nr:MULTISPECIES: dynamin family protein [unclassified Laspinema]MCT7973280.1 dynamin family protein [Laspinema sp. D3d]MCT7990799.1 dynamin family protein [Laspinema sp. D3a]MCT7995459.1 dynamin family protein [Laspinema sp. D3c]